MTYTGSWLWEAPFTVQIGPWDKFHMGSEWTKHSVSPNPKKVSPGEQGVSGVLSSLYLSLRWALEKMIWTSRKILDNLLLNQKWPLTHEVLITFLMEFGAIECLTTCYSVLWPRSTATTLIWFVNSSENNTDVIVRHSRFCNQGHPQELLETGASLCRSILARIARRVHAEFTGSSQLGYRG